MSLQTTLPAAGSSQLDIKSNRRTSIGQAFRSFKNAFRRIGGGRGDGFSSTSSPCERPIQTLIVDEEIEQISPLPETKELGDFPFHPALISAETDDETSSTPSIYYRNGHSRDRISSLLVKYGLPHDFDDLKPTPPQSDVPCAVLRVEKRPRLRIRWSCHVCQTTFKKDKECSNCFHKRCEDCVRMPPTSPRPATEESRIIFPEDGQSTAIGPSTNSTNIARPASVAIPEPDIDDSDMDLPRPVIERIKRACHKCGTDFKSITNSICETCGHAKCSQCTRQIKHIRYPYDNSVAPARRLDDGPRRRVFRKTRQRVRHNCEHCHATFTDRSRVCSECLHQRCPNCIRNPPRQMSSRSILEPEERPEPRPDSNNIPTMDARTAGIATPPPLMTADVSLSTF